MHRAKLILILLSSIFSLAACNELPQSNNAIRYVSNGMTHIKPEYEYHRTLFDKNFCDKGFAYTATVRNNIIVDIKKIGSECNEMKNILDGKNE